MVGEGWRNLPNLPSVAGGDVAGTCCEREEERMGERGASERRLWFWVLARTGWELRTRQETWGREGPE